MDIFQENVTFLEMLSQRQHFWLNKCFDRMTYSVRGQF